MSGKVKGCIGLFVFVAVLCGLFRACTSSFHNHEWQDANCTTAKICSVCGATGGDPLGHQWVDATCTAPKTCSVCGETSGSPRPHKWVKAICTEPKTCSVCGATDGEPRGHYAIINTTSRNIIKEPTCLEEGIEAAPCVRCGAMVESPVSKSFRHTYGEWEVVREATVDAPGKEVRYCTVCGEELESKETPQKTAPANNTVPTGSGGSRNGSNFNAHNNPDQQQTTAAYVLNTSTMKFHRPSCRDVPRIAPHNYATSNQSRSDLISDSYSPCGHCNP